MACILVVDDDTAGLDLRRLILEREGHRIFSTGNAVRARALFFEIHPDCVVLDLRLPELAAGLGLIGEFRRASQEVRIIVLSGWPLDLDGRPEAQMVNLILAKPIRTAALVSALDDSTLNAS
jgi:CheY-like chemotaxis protein